MKFLYNKNLEVGTFRLAIFFAVNDKIIYFSKLYYRYRCNLKLSFGRRENMIRSAIVSDAKAICDIYNHYVHNTIITFEEEPVSVAEMQNRIVEVTDSLPWLVLEEQGDVIGFAYASKWKSRCAYRFCVESTVYLAPHLTGRGNGRQLYEALISDLRSRSLHSVVAGIALPNPASVALHEKMGFEKVAHLKEVGWKFDQWIDVGYWELIL